MERFSNRLIVVLGPWESNFTTRDTPSHRNFRPVIVRPEFLLDSFPCLFPSFSFCCCYCCFNYFHQIREIGSRRRKKNFVCFKLVTNPIVITTPVAGAAITDFVCGHQLRPKRSLVPFGTGSNWNIESACVDFKNSINFSPVLISVCVTLI